MKKNDFYNSLAFNLKGKVDINELSLKSGAKLIIYKLGHDGNSVNGNSYVRVSINRNIVDIETYDNEAQDFTLVSSINWNKSFLPNMVSLTADSIVKAVDTLQ